MALTRHVSALRIAHRLDHNGSPLVPASIMTEISDPGLGLKVRGLVADGEFTTIVVPGDHNSKSSGGDAWSPKAVHRHGLEGLHVRGS